MHEHDIIDPETGRITCDSLTPVPPPPLPEREVVAALVEAHERETPRQPEPAGRGVAVSWVRR